MTEQQRTDITKRLREMEIGESITFPLPITFSVRTIINRMGITEQKIFKTKTYREEGILRVDRYK